MIYIASPYSDPDLQIMQARFIAARAYAARLTTLQITCYSPIVHFHPMAAYHNLPTGFDFWRPINEEMLSLAKSLHILCLTGWDKSVGVSAELEWWKRHRIVGPVYYYPEGSRG